MLTLLWMLSGAQAQAVRFVAIGDYGDDDNNSRAVSKLVASLEPEFILTVGDNDYTDGEFRGTNRGLELGVGQFYADWIGNYTGKHGPGSVENNFYPTPGDHDWGDTCDDPKGLDDYLDYFTLPSEGSGNERYYDFRRGPVHFFALHSVQDCERDGATQKSKQAEWVKQTAAASDAPFKVAFFHHPPWSSGDHGTDGDHMQWPWAEWGFDLVMAGHDHDYERIWYDNITSLVLGTGGVDLRDFGCVVAGSQVRYADDYGALLIEADDTEMTVSFHTVGGKEVDAFSIPADGMPTNTQDGIEAEECKNCGCNGAPGPVGGLGLLGLLGAALTRRRR